MARKDVGFGQQATAMGKISAMDKDNRQGSNNRSQAQQQTNRSFEDDIRKEKQPFGSIKDDKSFEAAGSQGKDIYDAKVRDGSPKFGRDDIRLTSASLPSEDHFRINKSERGGPRDMQEVYDEFMPSYKDNLGVSGRSGRLSTSLVDGLGSTSLKQ